MAEHEGHTPVSEDDLFPGASTSPGTSALASSSTSQAQHNRATDPTTSSPLPSQDETPLAKLSKIEGSRPSFIPQSPAISKLPDGRLVHQPSGYTWTREEDAPGYSWMSKRAMDEYTRAMDGIVDREKSIGTKYGDIGLNKARS